MPLGSAFSLLTTTPPANARFNPDADGNPERTGGTRDPQLLDLLFRAQIANNKWPSQSELRLGVSYLGTSKVIDILGELVTDGSRGSKHRYLNAVDALGLFSEKVLANIFSWAEVKKHSLKVLSRKGPEAVSTIITQAAHSDLDGQMISRKAIQRIGKRSDVLPEILGTYSSTTDARVREFAVCCLLDAPDPIPALDVLLTDLLRDSSLNASVQGLVAERLNNDRVFEKVSRAFLATPEDPHLLTLLSLFGERAYCFRPKLLSGLQSENPPTVLAAAQTLHSLFHDEHVSEIVAALTKAKTEAEIPIGYLELLGKIGAHAGESLPFLLQIMNAWKNFDLALHAAHAALLVAGKDAAENVRKMLQSRYATNHDHSLQNAVQLLADQVELSLH